MTTTPTFSRSGQARRAALFDEIEKISEELPTLQPAPTSVPPLQERKKPNWKNVLKAGAGYALGGAAGAVTGMAAERGLAHIFKDKWPQMSPEARYKVLYPLLGVATAGGMAVNHAAQIRRQQALEGDE